MEHHDVPTALVTYLKPSNNGENVDGEDTHSTEDDAGAAQYTEECLAKVAARLGPDGGAGQPKSHQSVLKRGQNSYAGRAWRLRCHGPRTAVEMTAADADETRGRAV